MQTQATRHWTLSRAHSVVELSVGTFWGLSSVSGRFERFDGSYEAGPAGPRIELAVDAESFATGSPARDERLRAAVSIAADGRSVVRFASTRIVDAGEGLVRIVGDVEAAGETHEVAVLGTLRQIDGKIELESTTRVEKFGRGIPSGPLGMLRPPATLHVKARFT